MKLRQNIVFYKIVGIEVVPFPNHYDDAFLMSATAKGSNPRCRAFKLTAFNAANTPE